MGFFRQLSERVRFLVYSLCVIVLPFLVMLILGIIPSILKQNLDNWTKKIFSQQEPYTRWEIEGPVVQKGSIRFENKISLQEVVKRVGGLEFGYRLSKESDHGPIGLLGSNEFAGNNSNTLDMTVHLEVVPWKYRRRIQSDNTNKSYYGRIKRISNDSKGNRERKNERKSRYR